MGRIYPKIPSGWGGTRIKIWVTVLQSFQGTNLSSRQARTLKRKVPWEFKNILVLLGISVLICSCCTSPFTSIWGKNLGIHKRKILSLEGSTYEPPRCRKCPWTFATPEQPSQYPWALSIAESNMRSNAHKRRENSKKLHNSVVTLPLVQSLSTFLP